MSHIKIRPATTQADRDAVFSFRYTLYVQDQGLFQDEADHERRWLRDHYDEHASIWIAERDGQVVGTFRVVWGSETSFSDETLETYQVERFDPVVPREDQAVTTRLLVSPELRGGPLVLQLIISGFEEANRRNVELVFANCEPHLVNLYLRMGFRTYGISEHPTNGLLVRVALVPGDLEHFHALRSPLAAALKHRTRTDGPHQAILKVMNDRPPVLSQTADPEAFWSAVQSELPREQLAELLGGLDEEELDTLLRASHALDCAPRAGLIRSGHSSRTLYILLTGTLQIEEQGQRVTEVSTPGEIVGEVAFFARAERMSDVFAGSGGARVLALSDRVLRSLIASHGQLAAKFLLSLTRALSVKLRERAKSS